jgi:indolepyruvate ferredoxin oxidoreductase, alpha subunit
MKKLLLGNEAIARGLYEAGCRFISSYPGTPSTEITEYAAEYDEIYAEWAPNEKVALEAALGAAIAGGRSFCAMKHVGLNVAADPLFITSYTGINGGFVIAVADDPGMHSSQNEQDSRHYAVGAKLPMIEPSDSAECSEYISLAYELSEKYDTPVIIRLCTRVSHARSLVELGERVEVPLKDYQKDPVKYVMMPGNAKRRHPVVEKRLVDLKSLAEDLSSGINKVEYNSKKIGIITSGAAYTYARECFGEDASYLKLGMVNPLPDKLIADFAAQVDRVIVVEELDSVIENHCKTLGLAVDGKNLLPLEGEYSQQLINKCLRGIEPAVDAVTDAIPQRPPVLCPGCPHRGVFYVLGKMKLFVSGDIGCYTLGAIPPLGAMDTTLCMGASVSAIHGINKVRGWEDKAVAVIGDSTFMHSGLTGLVNSVYNGGRSTIMVLDNHITGMTGHQQNPLTGLTLKNTPSPELSIEKLVEACGVKPAHIRLVNPADLNEIETVLKEELAAEETSVIICRQPCALLKYVKRAPALSVDADKCKKCKACMKIGCPCMSIDKDSGKAKIDPSICVGCGLCKQMCRFDAIS